MGAGAVVASCCARRWKGLVETSAAGGDVIDVGCCGGDVAGKEVAGVAASLACCICLKKGFFEPESVEDALGSEGTEGGVICGATGGDVIADSEGAELASLERT